MQHVDKLDTTVFIIAQENQYANYKALSKLSALF